MDRDLRMMTSKIKNSLTASELLDFVDRVVDKPIFNYIHVAAAYTNLGNLQKKRGLTPGEVQSNVLVRLERRLQGMLMRKELGEQALSNILWAFANLLSDIPAVLKIVPALAEQIPSKESDMIPQALSNSLWAAAQLQGATPEVLKVVPALAAEISLKGSALNRQELSNSLWAAAQLQYVEPRGSKVRASPGGADSSEGGWHDSPAPVHQPLGPEGLP